MIGIRLPDDAWGDVEAEALVARWLVAEGDRVRAGQPVVEVTLVKTNLEIVAPADGVLARILVHQDETFARGQDLALLEE